MTITQLATGFIALLGGDSAAQQSGAIYAQQLHAEGQTIGQSVLSAYKLGQRMKSQGFFYKTKQG
ncbi:MAG: hypothetical protein M0R47_16945 [Methylobacter sp.]|uniref:hypothetical protein n=1 Tax=Methylobacter sp. TaxID=2051955 RepID=UPI0025E83476|nr:hypothetical protein [Methylobacter sp.]MCK9622211.1 hypothetical protein [Methylobacter sp.]